VGFHEAIKSLIVEHGCDDYRWIDPQEIVVAQWVRLKCQFGCGEYGKAACCPPNTPSVDECERFFREYREALVFHFSTTVDQPEDRHAWTRKINKQLLKLERDIFLAGYRKAFLLFMDTCTVCSECAGVREQCKKPRKSRPSPEAMAVDVFATVRKVGYEVEVLSDYSQPMNRYAFLMVD
jgi:predicted metal-binding protein